MTIQPGQTYRSLTNRRAHGGGPVRIKVVGVPQTIPGVWGFGKVDIVTLTDTGREIRRRSVETSQLHTTPLTANGHPWRTGYVLDTPETR